MNKQAGAFHMPNYLASSGTYWEPQKFDKANLYRPWCRLEWTQVERTFSKHALRRPYANAAGRCEFRDICLKGLL